MGLYRRCIHNLARFLSRGYGASGKATLAVTSLHPTKPQWARLQFDLAVFADGTLWKGVWAVTLFFLPIEGSRPTGEHSGCMAGMIAPALHAWVGLGETQCCGVTTGQPASCMVCTGR